MSAIYVKKGYLKPSEDHHEILYNQFIWRTQNKFVGKNTVVVMDTQEPVWWNRPLNSDVFCKKESDGLYSYNLPYLYAVKNFKTGYNLLLGGYSVTYSAHIKIDENWTKEQIEKIENFSYNAIYECLIELGVPEEKLEMVNNDILYEGRKIMGGEKITRDGVFSEDLVITLNYSKEKHLFDRLTGKYANARGITGIGEIYPNITKEVLIDLLYKKAKKFFSSKNF